jgi:ankyrin repeat protein/arginine repressor
MNRILLKSIKAIVISAIAFINIDVQAQEVCLTSLEKEIITSINQHRVSKSLNELTISKTLMITANKNMEKLLNKDYTISQPDQFGDYKSPTAYIRTSISGTTSADIIRSLTSPSDYNKNAKIIENLGDYKNNKWHTIGICIRSTTDAQVPTSIIIYFGEKSESAFDISTCYGEYFFEITKESYKAPLKHPILKFTAPVQVTVFSTYTDANGKRIKLENNGFNVFEKGQRAWAYLDEPKAKFYEVFVSSYKPDIVSQEDIVFKVSLDDVKDTIFKTVEIKGNSLQDVKDYLENGGNINEQDDRKYTMLMRAVMRDDAEIVKYILEQGADVNILSTFNEAAITFTKSEKVFDLLMAKNPKTDLPLFPADKYNLLHNFSTNGILKGVKYLVEEKKVSIEVKTVKGATPLFHAVSDNHVDIARYLIEKGAKQTKAWGSYPVQEAVSKQNAEMLQLLLDNGGKVHINELTESGYSALNLAIMDINLELVKILVENGANVNGKDSEGRTTLSYCQDREGAEEIKEYLISKGAK